MSRGSNSSRGKQFFLVQNVQTDSVAQSKLLVNVYLGSFLRKKRPRLEADRSIPSGAEVQNEWSSTPNPLYSIMAWAGKTLRFTFNISIILQHTLRFRKWSLPYSCHVPVQHTNRPLHALPTPDTSRNYVNAKTGPVHTKYKEKCIYRSAAPCLSPLLHIVKTAPMLTPLSMH